MEENQWLKQWMEKRSYTKEDILHIAGKRLPAISAESYTKKDILNILGSMSYAPTSSRHSGA